MWPGPKYILETRKTYPFFKKRNSVDKKEMKKCIKHAKRKCNKIKLNHTS